jgi:hypothetical protein
MKKQKPQQPLWLSTTALARTMGLPQRSVRRWLAQAHQQQEHGVERSEGGFYRIPKREAELLLKSQIDTSFYGSADASR